MGEGIVKIKKQGGSIKRRVRESEREGGGERDGGTWLNEDRGRLNAQKKDFACLITYRKGSL